MVRPNLPKLAWAAKQGQDAKWLGWRPDLSGTGRVALLRGGGSVAVELA